MVAVSRGGQAVQHGGRRGAGQGGHALQDPGKVLVLQASLAAREQERRGRLERLEGDGAQLGRRLERRPVQVGCHQPGRALHRAAGVARHQAQRTQDSQRAQNAEGLRAGHQRNPDDDEIKDIPARAEKAHPLGIELERQFKYEDRQAGRVERDDHRPGRGHRLG